MKSNNEYPTPNDLKPARASQSLCDESFVDPYQFTQRLQSYELHSNANRYFESVELVFKGRVICLDRIASDDETV